MMCKDDAQKGDVMERRSFLKLTFGFTAGAAVLAAGAEAAPLPQRQGLAPLRGAAEPAIASQDDVDRLAPDQVRWRRRWGYRRRHWRRRYWGWPRIRFPRFWRRRYWW
jgi:hypothetical protein